MIRLCLPISQCRGQAYDGASNMSGHLNGVAAQIGKDVPAALFLHCFAHCTNLCLQTVGRQCVVTRDALDLVMRSTLFSALQTQLSPGSATLKPLCPTRWTVRTAAISAVLCNYSVLCVALEQIHDETHDEYGRKAGSFLAQMEKFSTFFGLKLSHLIYSGTEQLSLTLEGTMAAELAIQYLTRQRSESSFTFTLKLLRTRKISLHYLLFLGTDSLQGGLMMVEQLVINFLPLRTTFVSNIMKFWIC